MSGPIAAGVAGESTAAVRLRVDEARRRAAHRFAGAAWSSNAEIPASGLRSDWCADESGASLLSDLERRSLNLRGADRVLRMAWTVADLAGRSRPGRDDVATALGLRGASLGWAA